MIFQPCRLLSTVSEDFSTKITQPNHQEFSAKSIDDKAKRGIPVVLSLCWFKMQNKTWQFFFDNSNYYTQIKPIFTRYSNLNQPQTWLVLRLKPYTDTITAVPWVVRRSSWRLRAAQFYNWMTERGRVGGGGVRGRINVTVLTFASMKGEQTGFWQEETNFSCIPSLRGSSFVLLHAGQERVY